ncbi:U-box domain-containing protein 4 [Magnolia sinica]|uniref:U-box domain-containing protein 4 n=1 Tax=Magnolia sinica TaxID=86752 RepID=UPI002659A8E7|nr:U-box domain-containing protein 4 [Magnolia sinica]
MASSELQISGEDPTDSVRIPGTVHQTVQLIQSNDPDSRIQAAREIRRLTKTSSKHRRQFSDAIGPLVSMLASDSVDCKESAILALLNLAVKDERNKVKIVDAGALEPLIGFLRSPSSNLREYATAALLTLSASAMNKPTISSSGAIPLLVNILRDGTPQSKVEALMALYNLSTLPDNLDIILSVQAIPPLINLLKSCKKSSKTAEKCSALLESLLGFDEARNALTAEEGGVLTIVEVLEDGSLQSREHAVGALLTMCESDRCRFREAILKEGAIPGLLELTVQGTPKSQTKAKMLLQLLRDSPYPRSELQADTIENIVSNIVSQIDGDDRCGKAKKMLAEMVQVSMEQSLRHLQQRALVCTPAELPLANHPAEVPSK